MNHKERTRIEHPPPEIEDKIADVLQWVLETSGKPLDTDTLDMAMKYLTKATIRKELNKRLYLTLDWKVGVLKEGDR